MKPQTIIALNRFGLGARPGDFDRVGNDYRQWLLDQLKGPARTAGPLAALPDSATVLREVNRLRQALRASRSDPAISEDRTTVRSYGKTVRAHYLDQVNARYANAAQTDNPFFERLVLFWSNHFAVSADKQPLPAIAGVFENEAIRQHAGARFYDMLLAVEKHPAMLLYLDNHSSIGPASPVGQRSQARQGARFKGLNENLAREILELHTLGVDGGYSQQDVTNFARVITGWSIGGRGAKGDPGVFTFRSAVHEPGAHEVLGKRYAQRGVEQGEAVLQDMAAHPATARHLAGKLARHFVADAPPPALVDHIAKAYRDSDGHLPTVHAALVDGVDASQPANAKYKTPQDFFISTLRALERPPRDGQWAVNALDFLGQRPFQPGSPAGWPDTAEQWGGADALYKRIEWSGTLTRQLRRDVDPVALGDAVLGDAFTDEARTIVSRAESVSQGMTLLLASPDFQRR
ncbi:MAG: DUF1800 domain-containing protein [Pseudomonadota bacterium]